LHVAHVEPQRLHGALVSDMLFMYLELANEVIDRREEKP